MNRMRPATAPHKALGNHQAHPSVDRSRFQALKPPSPRGAHGGPQGDPKQKFAGGKLPPPETRSFTGHKQIQSGPVDGAADWAGAMATVDLLCHALMHLMLPARFVAGFADCLCPRAAPAEGAGSPKSSNLALVQ